MNPEDAYAAARQAAHEAEEAEIMERNQLDYLASLVRMAIRKRQRTLAGFAVRPGQDPAEAEAFREKIAADLAWKQAVLDALKGEQRSDGVRAIAQARQYLADGRVPVQDGDLITQAMWHLAAEGVRPRLERLALAGALVALEIEAGIRPPHQLGHQEQEAGVNTENAYAVARQAAHEAEEAESVAVSRYEAGAGIRPPRRSGKVRGVLREIVPGGGMEIWHCDHDHAPGVQDCRELTPAQRAGAASCARIWAEGEIAAGRLYPHPVRDEPE